MKSDKWNLLQEYEQRFEKLSEDQKLSRLRSEAGLRLVEVGQFFYTFPSPRGKANHSLCREYTLPRDQKRELVSKDGSRAMYDLAQSRTRKFAIKYGRYSIEVQVQSLFKDQTESWIRIVNGIDKFAREAMPIQEEEKASGETRCKGETNTKTVINKWLGLYSYGTETMDRHWNTRIQMILLVLKCQNSLLDYFDTVKKLIDKMMEQSIETKLLMNARKSYHTIQDTGQSKWRSNSPMLSIGQLTNGYQFWRKVEDRRKGFNIAWTRTILRKFLYLRAIQRHSKSTINPALQDNNVMLPEGFTESIYHVGNGKELRSIVNHGLTPGGVSLKTSRQAVFFTVVHPMDNQDGSGETLCDLSQARIAPHKNNWKRFQKTVFWCILKLAQQRGLQFSQTRSNAVILHDTLPAEFIQKAICMKTKDQL